MPIQAVIFDMDGVLIEARDWHYDALNRALRLFGYEISRHAHLTTYDGLPTRKKLQMLSLEQGLPSELHDFVNEMKQRYTLELAYALCKPVFQHEYALARLRVDGLRLACCSNSVRETIEVMLSRANLMRHLEFTLSNQDVTRPKPDPEIYAKAIARLNLSPPECLIVEDNENGIKAARASGAHVLVVPDTAATSYQNIRARIAEVER